MKAQGLGDILENLFLTLGLQRKLREQKILDLWNEMVGPGVAVRTQPVRVRNGVLQVKVTDSVWMNQLQFLKSMIVQKYRGKVGSSSLQDVRFFIGEMDGSELRIAEAAQGSPRPVTDLNEDERGSIEKEVAVVGDLETRQILSRLFAKSLIARKNGW